MPGLKFLGNLYNPDKVAPGLIKADVQAGATQELEPGDLCEYTANTNTEFTPLDSDYDMSGGDLAVCWERVYNGDRTGHYMFAIIAPGDVWEIDLNAAGNPAYGTAVYYSSKNTVTTTVGTNIVGHVADDRHYPKQGHLAVDGSPDAGTTLKTVSRIGITFETSNCFVSRLQKS